MTPQAQKDLMALDRKVVIEVSRSEMPGNGFSIQGDQGYKNGAWVPYNPMSILRHASNLMFGSKDGTWLSLAQAPDGLYTASFGRYNEEYSGEHSNEHVACAMALGESLGVEEG